MYSGDAGNVTFGIDSNIARLCYAGTLNTAITKGGILLCDLPDDGSVVISSEAVGLIMPLSDDEVSLAFPVPAVTINPEDYQEIIDYFRTTE